MARDADGNYYYDEGTIAELLDDWEVYEDSDGNVGFYKASTDTELRLHEAGHVFGQDRVAPDTTEIAQGETMLYVDSGALVAAHNTDGDTIITSDVITDLTT